MRRVYYFECVFNTRDARDAPRDASYTICDFLINAAWCDHFSDLVVGGVSLVVIGRLAPRGGCVAGRDWSIGTSLSSPSDGAPLTGVSPPCDARVCVAHRRASCVPCVRAWTSSAKSRIHIAHKNIFHRQSNRVREGVVREGVGLPKQRHHVIDRARDSFHRRRRTIY